MTAIPTNGATTPSGPPGSTTQFLIAGMWRFALVSLGGFSVWAFAGGWFYRRLEEAGLYAVTTGVFLGLAVLLLSPLVPGPGRVGRLCRTFAPAFLAYAVAWCLLWFGVGAGLGEWLGSLAGSLAFVAVTGWSLGCGRGIVVSSVVFFVAHSAGYFAGGWLMGWALQSHDAGVLAGLSKDLVGVLAKLSWGLAYGLGFGAGLGHTYHACQRRSPHAAPP